LKDQAATACTVSAHSPLAHLDGMDHLRVWKVVRSTLKHVLELLALGDSTFIQKTLKLAP